MTWKDTVQYYLSKERKDKDKDKQPEVSTDTATDVTPALEKAKEKADIPVEHDAKEEPVAGTSTSLSRNASVAKYKQRLTDALPVGQFEIGELTRTLSLIEGLLMIVYRERNCPASEHFPEPR
jgi:hypothetical protein